MPSLREVQSTAPVVSCHDVPIPGAGRLTLDVAPGARAAIVCEDPRLARRVASLLLGFVGPRRGELFVVGAAFHELDDEARDDLRAERLGFVMSGLSLVPTMTLLENLTLAPLDADPVSADEAHDVLERVGLGGCLDMIADELSDEAELAGRIARAVVRRPQLIIVEAAAADYPGAEPEAAWTALRKWADHLPVALLFVGPDDAIPSWVERRDPLADVLAA